MVHQDECLPAQRAAVGPLPAVRALVDPQAALLGEPLPALSAAVRPLARVRPVVYAEVGRALEVLPAHRAPKRPLPLVALLVQLELMQAAERLSALRANVGPRRARGGLVWAVSGEAALRESVMRRHHHLSLAVCVPRLRELVWLPRVRNMRRVSLRVQAILLHVLLQLGALGLKTGRLWRVLLTLAVIHPVARPLRGQLLHTRRLSSVRSIRVVRKCV